MIIFKHIHVKYAAVATPIFCLQEEIVQQVSQTQIAFHRHNNFFTRSAAGKKVVLHCVRKRNTYQHISDIDRIKIVDYWDCGSRHSIPAVVDEIQ